jgi:hypothetical protein
LGQRRGSSQDQGVSSRDESEVSNFEQSSRCGRS